MNTYRLSYFPWEEEKPILKFRSLAFLLASVLLKRRIAATTVTNSKSKVERSA